MLSCTFKIKKWIKYVLVGINGDNFGIRFDVNGYVTGFGNPDWARTHSAATSTAPVILDLLKAGATGVGKTFMDEMAYRFANLQYDRLLFLTF